VGRPRADLVSTNPLSSRNEGNSEKFGTTSEPHALAPTRVLEFLFRAPNPLLLPTLLLPPPPTTATTSPYGTVATIPGRGSTEPVPSKCRPPVCWETTTMGNQHSNNGGGASGHHRPVAAASRGGPLSSSRSHHNNNTTNHNNNNNNNTETRNEPQPQCPSSGYVLGT
jgi:hypothetical protein